MDKENPISTDPGANNEKGYNARVQVTKGEVSIRKTSYGMVIRLTQTRQNKPSPSHAA